MKTDFAKNTFTNLPPWARGIVSVVIIGGVAFGGWKIYKYIQHKKEMEGAEAEGKATSETLDKLKKKYKPSLDKLQLTTLANQLFTAMNGYGTDTSAIYRAFTYPKNDLDMVNLIKAYGIRKLSSGQYNVANDYEGTLAQCLTEELNTKQIQALNGALAKKGISYRF